MNIHGETRKSKKQRACEKCLTFQPENLTRHQMENLEESVRTILKLAFEK
jgi:Pyruvate/2-oxoacid:ferredoxin oxidoreductase delta subunit